MRHRGRVYAAILASTVALGVTYQARGYVRTCDRRDDTPASWTTPTIALTLSSARPSRDLDQAVVLATLREAAAAWSHEQNACSSLRITAQVGAEQGAEVQRDGVNAVIFREEAWCKNGDGGPRRNCYDPNMLAVTTLYIDRARPGEDASIREADIEINAVNYRWSANGHITTAAKNSRSLQGALLHELGHVIGLAHNCDDGTLEARTDHARRPLVSCGRPLPHIRRAVMFPEDKLSRTTDSLSNDERTAICRIYPFVR